MALVEIRDVYKSFKRDTQFVDVYTGLNIDFVEGSFTALMGPSGSGKSHCSTWWRDWTSPPVVR